MIRFSKTYGEYLKYFMQVQYVSKALKKKSDGRSVPKAFSYLCVCKIHDKPHLVSTDSRRLHYVALDLEKGLALDEGFYEVVSKSAKEIIIDKVDEETAKDLKFPDIDRIMPTLDWQRAAKRVDVLESKAIGNAKLYFPIFKEGVMVNCDYVKDAVIGRASVLLDPEARLVPVIVETEYYCNALIMPIQPRI